MTSLETPFSTDKRAPSGGSDQAVTVPTPPARRRPRPAWYGVLALGAITASFVFSDSTHLFTVNLCFLAVFGAISLDLLKGTAGLISIGNAGFMAMGAFVSFMALNAGVPFPLDLVLGAVAAGAAGVLIGSPALRLSGMHLFLATMAGHFIIEHFAREYQTHQGNAGGLFISPLYASKGIQGQQVYWAWTLFALVSLLILVVTRLRAERSGRAWRTMRDHEIVAGTLGINVARYKLTAFVISSTVIGFQGALMAHFTGSVTADAFTFTLAISFVVMVVIGGLDSVAGAVIGAVIVTALPILIPKVMTVVHPSSDAVGKGPAISLFVYGFLVVFFITRSPDGTIGFIRSLRGRLVARLARRA